jgi:hypothetical protein
VLLLQKNGKFKSAKQTNIEKATKAMYDPRSRYISITKKNMQKFIRYGRQLGSFSSK